MIIKTCGLREPENIKAVSALGVDWIGLIFYPKSPRFIGEQANLKAFLQQESQTEGGPKRVGVFVNAEFKDLLEAVHDYELDYVQLHGGESAVYCATLQQLWKDSSIRKAGIIRAFRVSRAFDFGITVDYEPYCDYFLFDTKGQEYGGTGHKFDWDILDRYTGKTPFLLSGGIGPEDAASVKLVAHPALAGIDLNSKFELKPGWKDAQQLAEFLSEL
jgi:phosphoribosylanthranilate isomerase